MQSLLTMLSDSFAAAEQPTAASEASKLAAMVASPATTIDSFHHSESRQQQHGSDILHGHRHNNSGKHKTSPYRQNSNAEIKSAFLGVASQIRPATAKAASHKALSVTAGQLETARCSLADSCSSFKVDTHYSNSHWHPDRDSDCHALPAPMVQDADQQQPVADLQVSDCLGIAVSNPHKE